VKGLAKQKQAEQVKPGWQAQSFTEPASLFPRSWIAKASSYSCKLRQPTACRNSFPAGNACQLAGSLNMAG